MNEMLFIAPVLRTPIVMAIANRALSAPINIWNDHSDIMSIRDVGWLAVFAENGQEALDLTILSFRIAEDPKVSLPITLNIDGFTLSHFIEPIIVPSRDEVLKWLPPFKPVIKLDIANPISIGLLGTPESYTEARKATDDVLNASIPVVKEAFQEFHKAFGREYKVVETYKTEDAETVLVTMGSISETAMTAIDELRETGEKVGVIRIRLWRPFPVEDFKKAVGNVKNLVVIDRHISLGVPDGPVALEVKSLFYHDPCEKKPVITNFVLGLGGRDVTREDFKFIAKKASEYTREKPQSRYELVGVWED
jgi:pyruvate ferredoxin oxidoreductase alpha subunit